MEEIPAAPGGDAKRRRHESIFKQSKKENGMDILQALQGDVSSPSSTPSPTTVVSFEDKLPDVGGVTKTSTIHRPSSLVLPPAKDNVKMESEPESSVVDVKATVEKSKGIPSDPKPGGPRKNLESPKVPNKPIAKSPKTAKELVKSPSPLKTLPAKSPTPSLKPQTATTVPVKSLPESPKTTPKQKAKTKNSSSTTKKASKAGSIVKGTPVLPAMAVQVKVEEAAPVAPKLVIKPVKQEPGIEARQQAVGQLSSKFPQSSEVHHKKVSKPSQEPAPADKTAGVKTTRPVKSEAGPQNAPLKFTLSQFLSAGSNSSSNVTLIGGMESLPEHKKKKKKHKEKDKDKKHKKVHTVYHTVNICILLGLAWLWAIYCTYCTLPQVKLRVWVRVGMGLGSASRKGWVGMWPATRLDPFCFSREGSGCQDPCIVMYVVDVAISMLNYLTLCAVSQMT